TSWPRSAKQAPATNPTYPEPTTAIRIRTIPRKYDHGCLVQAAEFESNDSTELYGGIRLHASRNAVDFHIGTQNGKLCSDAAVQIGKNTQTGRYPAAFVLTTSRIRAKLRSHARLKRRVIGRIMANRNC